MEYEIEERPLQMGEDPALLRPHEWGHPWHPLRPFQALRPEARDQAILIPEQEPVS